MSPTIRRLMKEAAELSASSPSPSPHFCAHPVNDSNLFDWHFTLAGPPAPSPYAGGIYHGRIVLPPQYPLRPPSFRFLTPSGRFEVNREICLSISGHHEESWQPAWGIRTALTAIRSFMDGDAKGQLGGLDATDEVRRMWAEKSRSWRCDVCSGSDGVKKTNEEILSEWREVCRQKGVALDAEGRETVPEELRMHYKKEKEKDETGDVQKNNGDDGGKSNQAPVPAHSTDAPAPLQRAATEDDSMVKQASLAHSSTSTTPPLSSTPSPTSSSIHAASRPAQPTTPSSSPPTTTTITSTSSPSSSTTIAHQGRVQGRVQPSSSDPWLDRAIVVVIIALIIMILRRVANVDDV